MFYTKQNNERLIAIKIIYHNMIKETNTLVVTCSVQIWINPKAALRWNFEGNYRIVNAPFLHIMIYFHTI